MEKKLKHEQNMLEHYKQMISITDFEDIEQLARYSALMLECKKKISHYKKILNERPIQQT